MNWHKIDSVLFCFYSVYVVNYNAIIILSGKGILYFFISTVINEFVSQNGSRFTSIKRYRKIRFLSHNSKCFSQKLFNQKLIDLIHHKQFFHPPPSGSKFLFNFNPSKVQIMDSRLG